MTSEADLEPCHTTLRLRVRFCETDAMGIVHHSRYLQYVEAARIEYLMRRGLNYRELNAKGFHMPVIEATSRFKKPARFNDDLNITVRIAKLTRVTTRFDYEVCRADVEGITTLVEGHTLLACVNAEHRPCRIPDELLEHMLGPETASPS
ncbi:MAG: acyl-CoA thioesterase [Polyangiaceae bacterium]|nr:acyl-CoA thioesterase [Polyangiaceae bacterium]